jgi:hypothetical protein
MILFDDEDCKNKYTENINVRINNKDKYCLFDNVDKQWTNDFIDNKLTKNKVTLIFELRADVADYNVGFQKIRQLMTPKLILFSNNNIKKIDIMYINGPHTFENTQHLGNYLQEIQYLGISISHKKNILSQLDYLQSSIKSISVTLGSCNPISSVIKKCQASKMIILQNKIKYIQIATKINYLRIPHTTEFIELINLKRTRRLKNIKTLILNNYSYKNMNFDNPKENFGLLENLTINKCDFGKLNLNNLPKNIIDLERCKF